MGLVGAGTLTPVTPAGALTGLSQLDLDRGRDPGLVVREALVDALIVLQRAREDERPLARLRGDAVVVARRVKVLPVLGPAVPVKKHAPRVVT